jgi:LPS O-antigen subunit length determinant protein (WzzB/FepE family)
MNDPQEPEHPRGALLFILVYLLGLVVLWVHVYLRLWVKG